MAKATINYYAPIYNYGTIHGNVVNPVYSDCGKPGGQNAASSVSPETWESMQTDEAKAVWRKLVDAQYCHVKEAGYEWDASSEEYGYMVYIVSDLLHLRHPSTGRLQWQAFQSLFCNAKSIEKTARSRVSENLAPYKNPKSWCEEAKKIKRLLA